MSSYRMVELSCGDTFTIRDELNIFKPGEQYKNYPAFVKSVVYSPKKWWQFWRRKKKFGYVVEWVGSKTIFDMEKMKMETTEMVSYERVVQILQDYVCNDAEAAEIGYVRDILESVCGVTRKEAENLGLGYLFDE